MEKLIDFYKKKEELNNDINSEIIKLMNNHQISEIQFIDLPVADVDFGNGTETVTISDIKLENGMLFFKTSEYNDLDFDLFEDCILSCQNIYIYEAVYDFINKSEL